MGQGTLLPSLSRGLLLVVMAIQGLTPDLNDLASPLAMILICPSLVDVALFQVEDDSPDDVCELTEPVLSRGLLASAHHLPPTGLTMSVLPFQTAHPVSCGYLGKDGVVTPASSSRDQLCRLLC
jgi:hypothetical protein